jgi:hypothetical protein
MRINYHFLSNHFAALLLVTLALLAGAPLHAQLTITQQPTPVTDGEPYVTQINTIIDIGQSSIHIPIKDVPLGKRLVVRDVRGIIYGADGETYKLILLSYDSPFQSVGQDKAWYPIPVDKEQYYDGESRANFTPFAAQVYINAKRDPDNAILYVSLVRSNKANSTKSQATFVRMTISGYLLPTNEVNRAQ